MVTVTKQRVIGKIEVLEDGQLQVREDGVIAEDGVEIARLYHRHVLVPGDDTTAEDTRVKLIAAAVWTQAVIDAYWAARNTSKTVLVV